MLPQLISAGTALAGGLLNRSAAKDANAQNAAMAAANIEMQEKFAQQGIRWKVADARAAGIHPLYALGAQTTSFSPVSVGAVPASVGNALAAAGQDVSRSINATRTAPERLEATAAARLQLEGLSLDNDIKRATYASALQKIRQNENPPMPTIGPFEVPEAKKSEDRQPLMVDGNRVLTDPGTSPAKAWEDQLGDDVFSPGFLPNLRGMLKANTQGMSLWDILRAIDHKTSTTIFPDLSGVPRWLYEKSLFSKRRQ